MPQDLKNMENGVFIKSKEETNTISAKKILLVATLQCHVAQFHKPILKWLCENGCRVDIAAKNNLDTKPGLHLEIPGKIYDIPFSRSPFGLGNIRSFFLLKK